MEIYIAVFMFMILFVPLAIANLNRTWLLKLLLLAAALRVAIALVHRYVFQLPQGTADALAFNRTAIEWANMYGCTGFFEHFNPSASYVYSSILAIFYGCMGQSILGAHVINIVLSLYGVYFITLSAQRIWGDVEAKRVALILAIFPFLAIYSAMLLREAFIFCFFSFAIYAIVRFTERDRQFHWLIASFIGFYLASLFHGAMILGAGGVLVATALRPAFQKSRNGRDLVQKVIAIIMLVLTIGGTIALLYNQISIGKIGNLAELELEDLSLAASNRATGNAAYLTDLTLTSPSDLIWQTPLRTSYLLFSPFPWDIRSPAHILGLLEGVFFLWLTVIAFKNRRYIVTNPTLVALLITVLFVAVAFAYGTSNFGSANRHRNKFFLVMLVIVAPWINQRLISWGRYRSHRKAILDKRSV